MAADEKRGADSDAEHFRRLERMYRTAPCNVALQPAVAIERGRAEVRFRVRESFHHAAGAVHGAWYFKALDDAAFFAVASLVPETFAPTVSFTVQLLRPVASGELRAVGRVVRSGRTLMFAEATLHDERGEELARGSGVFAVSGGARLADCVGYRDGDGPARPVET